MTAQAAPRHSMRPAIVALGCPNRRENTIRRMLGLRLISSRMTCSVRSGEGSRQKMIS